VQTPAMMSGMLYGVLAIPPNADATLSYAARPFLLEAQGWEELKTILDARGLQLIWAVELYRVTLLRQALVWAAAIVLTLMLLYMVYAVVVVAGAVIEGLMLGNAMFSLALLPALILYGGLLLWIGVGCRYAFRWLFTHQPGSLAPGIWTDKVPPPDRSRRFLHVNS
jgi:hypothetical protein